MKTVAIIYGWAEGPWQAKLFKKELAKHGYKVINEISSADIIFAHSSGCYLIPKDNKSQSIFLVGLPCWPGRSLAASVIYKLIKEVKHHRKNEGLGWWFNKITHNTWYILSRPRSSYYIFTRHNKNNLPDGGHKKVAVTRPRDDTMCHPQIMGILPKTKNYVFVELPGAHDDCWIKPEQYIGLLSSLK